MPTIYFKQDGKKVPVEVTDEQAQVITETRRKIWRNEAKERYYRKASLDAMTDCDKRTSHAASPETLYIAAEECAERTTKLTVVLKSLTPKQLELVKMLERGMSVTEIARVRGVSKQSIFEARERIRKRFAKFLK